MQRYMYQGGSMELNLSDGIWVNEPSAYQIANDSIVITTEPETDFWQRSYYGFRNDNAPTLLFASNDNFTFTLKAQFSYRKLFDQCGIIIYLDSENWFKASIEYENDQFSRLGSVVTNNGYSDWATSDIETPSEIWYRLSRRGPDFLIESSSDDVLYKQMRVFHLHLLGETTLEMGSVNPPFPPENSVRFGLYACSPSASSFKAKFSNIKLEPSKWLAHGTA
jgi:regulation of enolase protein 1 (concanavalin A-like superfamily)